MKRQRGLSDEQERMRLEGLRILARIIARHYHANPEKYPRGAAKGQGALPPNGRPALEGERPPRDGTA